MRFFTRDLFAAFNSEAAAEADRADRAWERAISSYREHLAALLPRLPAAARRLAQTSLHDAVILEAPWQAELDHSRGPGTSVAEHGVAPVYLQRNGKIVILLYQIWAPIEREAAPDNWALAEVLPQWLYDEIDTEPGQPGLFWHRVLLSTGSVISIPMRSVVMHQVPARDVGLPARAA